VVLALAAALAGCGGTSSPPITFQHPLTVYSDLPLSGPQGQLMTSIENGELLALDQAHAHRRALDVGLEFLSDAPQGSGWTPSTTQSEARFAAQDADAIAYIGDFDSGATAISLSVTNPVDILQVSPSSPYVGLTNANPIDDKGEPGSHYLGGTRTFARLVPTDVQEARATVRFMRYMNVASLYTITDDAPYVSPFDSAIAPLTALDAPGAGITVVGSSQINSNSSAQPASYASLVATIAGSHADAVIVGAAADPGTEALWQELAQEDPGVKLFAPSTLATGPFLAALGEASEATFVTSPILPLDQYPQRSRKVLAAYRRQFGRPTAYSLYGYEAMSSVLAAIRRAGKHDGDRLDVVRAYFHLGLRKSVIGRYRISNGGDTSLTRFAGYGVRLGGELKELGRFSGA